ncbi:MAG: adenylate/guanylate cyclase domain-containing protein [Methylococcales bacterium]|nr:adenylate/guanylate cyclase domain-containing protein [Methylococcales bacterium]
MLRLTRETLYQSGFVILAWGLAILLDTLLTTHLDAWVHDSALVYQARQQWRHVAVVALDDQLPYEVSRKQALPLFARAADIAVAAGARGVFLDARIARLQEGIMPYALCIDAKQQVQWSNPACVNTESGCQILNSSAGQAPLAMRPETLEHFLIAPYLPSKGLDFTLYGWEASLSLPQNGVVASDRLITQKTAIARWLDLSPDHAVVRLAEHYHPEQANASLRDQADDEVCDQARRCRRIRLSRPIYQTQLNAQFPLLPLSALASCDTDIAARTAAYVRDRVVIFQVTMPHEATDILITPMTSNWLTKPLMTPGAQYLADAVETLLQQDHPRRPLIGWRWTLFLALAFLGVAMSRLSRPAWAWLLAVMLLGALMALCFFTPLIQLWPVTASMVAYLSALLLAMAHRYLKGIKAEYYIQQYMSGQVLGMLFKLKQGERFQSHQRKAVVLMSDMAGYTSITGLLHKPVDVLELMNDYLTETSLILDQKYHGVLEAYVGDMVCYYWVYTDSDERFVKQNCLQAALELAQLQQQFFANLTQRYQQKFDQSSLEAISRLIDAGIGLTSGEVVMGNMGPERAVRKFSILGDPLNLAARIESLTRLFNADILITQELADLTQAMGYAVRRLGRFYVKGRPDAAMLFALGDPDKDLRFCAENIRAWHDWLHELEAGAWPASACSGLYAKDQATFEQWFKRGLLTEDRCWRLDHK